MAAALTWFLLVLLFLLSLSSLFNHYSQNKLLVQCEERQAKIQQRLDGILRSLAKQTALDESKQLDRASDQTRKVMVFLSEVLGTRESKRKTDFENLFKECQEKNRALNDTFSTQLNTVQVRLTTALNDLESSRAKLEQLRDEASVAKAEALKVTQKYAKSKEDSNGSDQVWKDKLEKAERKIVKLKAQLQSAKSAADADSSFFSSLDAPPSLQATRTVTTKAKSKPLIEDETFKPSRARDDSDCEKESFVFNAKRSGVPYAIHTATSANRCKRLCVSEDLCKAWTYVSDTTECLLQRETGGSIIADCCVSGVKCA